MTRTTVCWRCGAGVVRGERCWRCGARTDPPRPEPSVPATEEERDE